MHAGTGTLSVSVENLLMSSEVNHKKKSYQFGIAILALIH